MQGIWSSAAVRSFSTCATPRASRWLSPVVTATAGELAKIPMQLPLAARAARLSTLAQEYCGPLAEHLRLLEAADGSRTDEENGLIHTNSQVALSLWTLLSVAPELLERYEEPTKANKWPRLQSSYAKQYQQESCDTFHELLDMGLPERNIAASYAAALAPGLRDSFLGEGWRDAASKDSKEGDSLLRRIELLRKGTSNFDGLSEDQVLALRAYAHPDSHAFNLMRASDVLVRLLPDLDVTHSIREIPGQIHEAACALYKLPSARVWGNLYKGLQSRPGDRWEVGTRIVITRPYSATVLQEQSYAGRVVREKLYDVEFLLMDGSTQRVRAVMLAAFHPPSTFRQGEVLVLGGQEYCVKKTEVREVPNGEHGPQTVLRCVAVKVADQAQ